MAASATISSRYEIRGLVGRGGMGLVYRAFDKIVGREVALKTVVDVQGRHAIEMFYKEWRMLANLHHPNIIEIYDIGEFEDSGVVKPFFVMPLLKGMTLEQLLQTSGGQIAADRLGAIVTQTCHGLQAIHDTGLVHRDLKPANIFVLDFDAVKLIDFGIAHIVSADTATSLKGTAGYMSPEQIAGKECSPQSDIFALGVVCYEALTGVKPFDGRDADEVFDAILHRVPLPINELNPAVSQVVSRVIHKALAKEPRHRYKTAIDFAETLASALRGEPIPALDPTRIQPRIQRAIKAFEQGNYDLATEILGDLEAAGEIDPALVPLRKQIDDAVRRTRVRRLLDRARMGVSEEEYPLALQNIQAALDLEPANDEGLQLRAAIRSELARRDIDEWLKAAQEAVSLYAFARARQLLTKVLELRPGDPVATAALQDLDHREQAYRAARQEKESLFRAAKEAWQNSEFETAAAKIERVMELEARAPDTASSDNRAHYASFVEMVHSARAAIEHVKTEVPRSIQARDYARALDLCREAISKYPGHPLPRALKLAAESHWRSGVLAKLAEVGRETEAQPDLRSKLDVLQRALQAFPSEPLLERWAEPLREQLILADTVTSKACAHEAQGRYQEALEQWRTLLTLDPGMPGLQQRIDRASSLAGVDSVSQPLPATSAVREPVPPVSVPGTPAPPQFPPPEAAPASKLLPLRNWAATQLAKPLRWLNRLRASANSVAKPQAAGVRPPAQWSKDPGTRMLVGTVIVAVLLIAAGLVVTYHNRVLARKPPSSVVPAARLALSSATPNATITAGNTAGKPGAKLDVQLPPATYAVEVSRDGYETYHGTVSLPAGGLTTTLPELKPLDAAIHLSATLPNARILLDNRPSAALDQSDFTREDLKSGDHQLTISANRSEAHITFSTAPGDLPQLKPPIQSTDLLAYAVTELGPAMRIAAGTGVSAVTVDGVPAVAGTDGIFQFTARTNQPHEVVIGSDKDQHSFIVGTARQPSLWVVLVTDRNEGSITVSTGLDKFKVFLDGKPYTRKIRDGSMSITGLPSKHYQLHVVADGFEPAADRDVEVRKGLTSMASFTLTQVPQFSNLAIQGILPHTQVLLDTTVLGVAEDGAARYGKISPGEHTLEFRNSAWYKPLSLRKIFLANETLSITGADVILAPNPAEVTFASNQPGTQFSWSCGQATGSGETATCLESGLTVTATLAGFREVKREIKLTPGQKLREPFDLSRIPQPQLRTFKTCEPAELLQGGWTEMQGWYGAGNGADLPCARLLGRYQFTVPTPTGIFGGKSTWIVQGSGAPVQFELQKKSLQQRGAAKVDIARFENKGTVTFRLTLEAGRIVQEVRDGERWQKVSEVPGDFKAARVHFLKDARIANFAFREQ